MRLAFLLAVMAALPAHATEVVRLSDAQREAVIAAAANGPEKTPVLTPEPAQRPSVLDRSLYPEFYADGGPAVRDRKVHGEMSVFAGSGGTFGVSGTALLPVGDTGTAMVSVTQGSSRWGGIQGFSLGYASGDAQNSLGFSGGYNDAYNNGYNNGFGAFGGQLGGLWTTPYGRTWNPALQMRRR